MGFARAGGEHPIIEKIAVEICWQDFGRDPNRDGDKLGEFMLSEFQQGYYDAARNILAAIREPTHDMVYGSKIHSGPCYSRRAWLWRKMIDVVIGRLN